MKILLISINLEDFSVSSIDDVDFFCISNRISKSEAISFLQNPNLTGTTGTLSHIKIGQDIITFGDIEIEKQTFHHSKNNFLRKCRC